MLSWQNVNQSGPIGEMGRPGDAEAETRRGEKDEKR